MPVLARRCARAGRGRACRARRGARRCVLVDRAGVERGRRAPPAAIAAHRVGELGTTAVVEREREGHPRFFAVSASVSSMRADEPLGHAGCRDGR